MTNKNQNNDIEAKKQEIIGWMNYGIPRGKTIPVFEYLLDELLTIHGQKMYEKGRRDAMERLECIECGCTEHNACEGGCSWLDICSACYDRNKSLSI